MDTSRLRVLSDPRQAQVLLDAFVSTAGKLPPAAHREPDLARLPLAFLDPVERAESQGSVWSAWTKDGEAWLFVGQLNLHRARERGQPVLDVESYDYERRIKSRSVALRSPTGIWEILKD